MAKHTRKRQKTTKLTHEPAQPAPLGAQTALTDEASKDDEERRLESMLFGVPFVPSGKHSKEVVIASDDDADMDAGEGGKELENLLDSDLFFVDDSVIPTTNPVSTLDDPLDISDEEGEDANAEADPEPPSTDIIPETLAENDTDPPAPADLFTKSRKAPAWTDPDDSTVQVSLASNNRLRKLRDAPSEDVVAGREYERRLRRQFEKINPTPEWATNARKKMRKRRRASGAASASGTDGEDDAMDIVPDLLSSTAGISGSRKTKTISQGTLSIERLRDANQSAPAEGEIKSLQFHPSPHVPVLLTASADRRLRLFHIDGLTNPHARTLHVPSLPISNAVFHPNGSSVLMTGPRPFYYTYDLQSGASHRSPRGLWGTTFSNANQDASMEVSAFSPTGDILAVAGRRGHIHLVDWRSGAAQVVGGLKANATVRSLWWSRAGGGELLSMGEDSQVYIWDVGQRKCVKRWQDDGGFGSRGVSGDKSGRYLTIGSTTGLVNVYSANAVVSSGEPKPKPLKTIGNLVTNISTMSFNHDSQLLALASNVKKDQMRTIHLPSLTAFGNWPTTSTPLGHVTAVDFSTDSQYAVIGNNRGRVLLYHLRDFGEFQ
ncbi:WD40-repeat-containing domain protein [Hygrophoropsis aurantiaca]|uniref:WD40-repeat-containing domain protein n=1 Tax=Hygrophoropsis aurantiaca TaxID=72124 RepID=A0ACB8A1N2_9AGAM|nr:WD40-repeat-containing domain protein [Hygrophoropsis aurantiaca]